MNVREKQFLITLCLLMLSSGCSTIHDTIREMQPMKGVFHNEDCTNFFWYHDIPAGKAGELIDRYIDVMAGAGINVFICNTNSRRTNYRSAVWDSYWDGYDPAGQDDQPFLASIPRKDIARYRQGIGRMLAVHQQGIDYPARVIKRCRYNGISPWITLRMNDCHNNDNMNHPFHGSFWKKNPQLWRKNCQGYFARCLDYAHPEVRDYYKALIIETLERYDIDGLELDFMREPYLFSAGKEAEGAPILTAWMCEVRKLTADAAVKRGHPIRVGVRVPSRPETALSMGLDAITWAREGLIDLLVVTPRWATLEFDMPIERWRELLGSSKVTLAGGLEINYKPCPVVPANCVSPELAAGAAVSVLSRGADAVYLFNYFQDGTWPTPVYQNTLKAMKSLDSLLKLPRSVGVTYRDITGPGEKYQAPLPATGTELMFPVRLGPVPDKSWLCELRIGFKPPKDAALAVPTVLLNGKPCEPRTVETTKDGLILRSFSAPTPTETGVQEIRIVSKDSVAITVHRLEASLRAPRL
ncbi:MAG: hypothetical protein PHR77_11390 [Kiritimatiellae bacterium]|nr:hypothetical protein [Kiritimatiellia bacterium]MDD5519911.1 hypothetical protein [Kiritimatiellia bacterium]